MISDIELKNAMYKDLAFVKSLLLTHNDIDLLKYIRKELSVTPGKIAIYRDVNVNNASTKLKKLFEQGYLTRIEDKSSSGGVEYIYSISNDLQK